MFVGCVPAHAAYFSLFERMKVVTGADRPGHHPAAAAACGVVATAAHDSIMGPMDTVKQRLQLGHYRGLLHCVRTIVKTEGLGSLFVSLPTTMAMNLPFGAVMVTANESLKEVLLGSPLASATGEHTIATHMVAGSGAGAIAAVATTPLDMVKTRLQTQDLGAVSRPTVSGGAVPHAAPRMPGQAVTRQVVTISVTAAGVGGAAAKAAKTAAAAADAAAAAAAGSMPRLTGMGEAAQAIYREAGMGGFTRGLVPRLLVSAPSVAVSWTAYECAKGFLLGAGF